MRINAGSALALVGGISLALAGRIVDAGSVTTVVAVGLALAVAAFAERRVAWILFLLSVAATGVSITVDGGTVRPELLAVPLLLLALRGLGSEEHDLREFSGASRATSLFLGIFLAVGLYASVFVAMDAMRSLWIWAQLANSVACFLLLRRSEIPVKYALWTGTTVVSAISVLGVLAFISSHISGITAFGFALSGDGRVKGLSIEPNIFACQAVGWLALLYRWRACVGRRQYLAAVPIVIAACLAGTRIAWLALAFLGAYSVIRAYRRPRLLVGATMGMVGALAVIIAIIGTLEGDGSITSVNHPQLWRLTHLTDTSTGTGAYRLDTYRLALQDIAQSGRWLMGSGLNSYSQYHLLDLTKAAEGYLSSIWYELIYDTGLVGLATFLGVVASLFFSLRDKKSALPLFLAVFASATTTNTVWLAFMWTYFALADLGRSTSSSRDEVSPEPLRGAAPRAAAGFNEPLETPRGPQWLATHGLHPPSGRLDGRDLGIPSSELRQS